MIGGEARAGTILVPIRQVEENPLGEEPGVERMATRSGVKNMRVVGGLNNSYVTQIDMPAPF
jgi:hypothetical protein